MPSSRDLAGELRIAIGRASRRIRAERERIQPPSMTRTVNSLVELGLVAKAEHPTDGRQVVVSLTVAGRAEVVETRRRRDTWLTERLKGMTKEERQLLADAAELLRRIAAS